MIYLGATNVTEIFLGDYWNPIINIGSYKTFPAGTETTAITNMRAVYSDGGSYLTADGSNWVYLKGDLVTYIDGSEYSRAEVYLNTLSISSATGDTSFWETDTDGYGNEYIYAGSRGTVTGNTRSAKWTARYGSTALSSSVTITQEANRVSQSAGAITAFTINGSSSTVQVSNAAEVLYITSLSGYRNLVYTSTATARTSITSFDIDTSVAVTWVSFNGNYINIDANSATTTRSATIVARDADYPSVSSSIVVAQAAAEDTWDLTVPTALTIGYSDTSFTISGIVSKHNDQPYDITGLITISPNNINAAITNIYHQGSGVYNVSFSCSANTNTTDRYTNITITQPQAEGGEVATCRVTQRGDTSVMSGITVYGSYGDWIVGTVKVGTGSTNGETYDVSGILVAKTSPITGTASVTIGQIKCSYKLPAASATEQIYQGSVSNTISSGATVTIRPYGFSDTQTYYGAWLIVPNLGTMSTRPNTKIYYVSGLYIVEE